jgi:hydrogenase maturation protein HypF
VDSLSVAQRFAEVDTSAREALLSTGNPIVLLPAKPENGLAANIHPGLNTLGMMLASSPLHWLLLRDYGRPLVVTSGNVEGQPLEVTPESAQRALAGIADLWLHHNREIRHAVDDSVVRVIAARPVTVRLARGLAPLQLPLETEGRMHTFAVGGHQKSAFAFANVGQAVLGPHIGDLDGTDTRERYVQQASLMNQLYGLRPDVWVHDQHPDYFTTQWARSQPGRHVAVQHHHAHVVAGMLEHGWLDREVLGVAFDGTGYGTDGTVWGGEFLQATVTGFSRVAHLRTFALAGNEAAVREPWRAAAALAHQAVDIDDAHSGLNPTEREAASRIRPILERPGLSPRTSSAGRLFDGVASLVLGIEKVEFKGQAAQFLESISDPAEPHGYSLPVRGIEVDWRPMIRELLIDRQAGVVPGTMAMRYHRGLALAIASVCRQFANLPVVLVGGVFQNRLLVELVVEALRGLPPQLGLPGVIPPNDAGLAAGQLAVGLMTAERERRC